MIFTNLVNTLLMCSWNYTQFNIEFPDKHVMYHGMVLPLTYNNELINDIVINSSLYPIGRYFSIQFYQIDDWTESYYSFNDELLLDNFEHANYNINLKVNTSYLVIYRIYLPQESYKHSFQDLDYWFIWGNNPPDVYINNNLLPICKQNFNNSLYVETNYTDASCRSLNEFIISDTYKYTLPNYDADYIIACINTTKSYVKVEVIVPRQMCSKNMSLNEYDLRYASLNLVTINAPRSTYKTYYLSCNSKYYNNKQTFTIPLNNVQNPAILYRQVLPNKYFTKSIQHAKIMCDSSTKCLKETMDNYYPILKI